MQMARLTVTKEESEFFSDVLKDFELICYCDHFTLHFCSGSKWHQIVAQMDLETPDKVSVKTTRETWCRYLEGVVQNAWDLFKDSIVAFSGEKWSVYGRAFAAIAVNLVPAPKCSKDNTSDNKKDNA